MNEYLTEKRDEGRRSPKSGPIIIRLDLNFNNLRPGFSSVTRTREPFFPFFFSKLVHTTDAPVRGTQTRDANVEDALFSRKLDTRFGESYGGKYDEQARGTRVFGTPITRQCLRAESSLLTDASMPRQARLIPPYDPHSPSRRRDATRRYRVKWHEDFCFNFFFFFFVPFYLYLCKYYDTCISLSLLTPW